MKHAVSRELHGYWDRLRGGRTAPERGDIDPAAIRQILAYTFVLDVAGGALPDVQRSTFRLSGTRLDALFGRDLRGTAFARLWDGRDAPVFGALFDGVLQDRVATVASVRGGPPGCEAIDLELLLLPLRHHGRTHARVLGSLAAATVPGWMGLRAVTPLRIATFRDVSESVDVLPLSPPGAHAMHHAPEAREPAVAQVGRFRVYQGGRRDAAPAGLRP